MPLVTCPDCQQRVSSEAVACPSCGRPLRDRSHLTPSAQAALGGVLLIACLAWPPLFVLVVVLAGGQALWRVAHRSRRAALLASGLLVIASFGVSLLFPSYAIFVVGAGLCGGVWFIRSQRKAEPASREALPAEGAR
jgi:hypothetical protein